MSLQSEKVGYALTPVQQGMLFHSLQARHSGADIQQLVVTATEAIDVDAFRAAWNDIVAACPILRTQFRWSGEPEPLQQILPRMTVEPIILDLADESPAVQQSRVAAWLRDDRIRGFDLSTAPLLRVAVFLRGAREHTWVWTFPHILLDGGSFAAIITDLYTAYEARCEGRAITFASRPDYAEFIAWLTPALEQRRDTAKAFFAEQLRGVDSRNQILGRPPVDAGPQPADRQLVDVATMLSETTTSALRARARDAGVSMNTLVQAAWSLIVSDFSGGDTDVVFGIVRRGRSGTIPNADAVHGMFINTLPLRVRIDLGLSLVQFLIAIRAAADVLRAHEQTALLDVEAVANIPRGEPLFDSIIVFNATTFAARLPKDGAWQHRRFEWIEQTNYPLTLFAYDGPSLQLKISSNPALVDRQLVSAMMSRLEAALCAFEAQFDVKLGELARIPGTEREQRDGWNATELPVPPLLVHQFFEAQVRTSPDAIALAHRDEQISYATLDARANHVAELLQQRGVGPDVLVGIYLERGIDMVVALLATLKAGGAYVPLDPGYPSARIVMMLEDCAPRVILTQASLLAALPHPHPETLVVDGGNIRSGERTGGVESAATPSSLAYMIFTSGSTGRPKGVMIEHRNVANFFVGMDARLGTTPGVWLAVTSISFDISVLELFWTLARGYKVVIQDEASKTSLARQTTARHARPLDFSLFYFAADADKSKAGRYRLLLEGARYADTHGFAAIWTPERHFHAFGGLYPNPSVTSAAVAAITTCVQIRAGSVVLPLHDPIRIAEEWSVVDNLSNGRVGLSFASGWHANDFALAPHNYESRRALMYQGIETIRRLWRGESVTVKNGTGQEIAVNILPRPVQAEPQIWVSAAGSTATFEAAGAIGANMLTNMLGQSMDDLRERITAYRLARANAGHSGSGHVSLMLHTFLGDDVDTVKALVHEPFMQYLRTSTDLVKKARWEFPAFSRKGGDGPRADQAEIDELSHDDADALMRIAFERYFRTHGLFGTPDSCANMIEMLKGIGVDEVACLIDFGIDEDEVLASLDALNTLRERSNAQIDFGEDVPIGSQLRKHAVTHLQCTPSLAQVLLLDSGSAAGLADLRCLMLGGEALPDALAQQCLALMPDGRLLNMYGPTETSIWSTVAEIHRDTSVTIGTPIANTQIYLLNRLGQLSPRGTDGELCIGGAGVGRGYHERPDLTAQRFVDVDVQRDAAPVRVYRTGDLARQHADGTLTFAGRLDHQLKVRGYRIELGEIESALLTHPSVEQAVVVPRDHSPGDTRLIGYVTMRGTHDAEAGAERPEHWRDIWTQAYSNASADVVDATFNVAGWSSSVTGDRLPDAEMREWVDHTVERIRALRPKRVLSIGCGTGLLLFRLASECEQYTGVDYAASALDNIRRGLNERTWTNVQLVEAPAHDLRAIPDAEFNVVVINSVAQYFPTAEYMQRVMRQALAKLAPGGALFIGDVRSLSLLDAFHTSVVRARSSSTTLLDNIAAEVRTRLVRESELVIDPQWFEDFAVSEPDVDGISVELKSSTARNEMSCFRYDVVLRKSSPERTGMRSGPDGVPGIDATDFSTVAEVRAALAATPSGVRLAGLANARVSRDVHAALLLLQRGRAGMRTLADLETRVGETKGLDPADVYAVDSAFDVTLEPSPGAPDRFDAVFRPRGEAWTQRQLDTHAERAKTASDRSNIREPQGQQQPTEPERTNLAAQLATRLAATLPDYMVPHEVIVLDAMPLTPNGKIDRKALPAPGQVRVEQASRATFTPPGNPLERQIAVVLGDVFGNARLGVRDNFFEIGANSLLLMQANSTLRQVLGIPLPLVKMFEHPTIASLANYLESTGQMPTDEVTIAAAATAGQERAQARRGAIAQRGK